MKTPILNIAPLGFPWETSDPFLFCAHHEDFYPAGNSQMGPQASLAGRNLGNDFVVKDGFRMYHGKTVPGFPAHPHSGFETVTLALKGLVDHSDSLGAAGRFGNGDVQWMTAGNGVQHSEMFPLLNQEGDNPFELFQIWLNLPKASKQVPPHFAMLWREDIPRYTHTDAAEARTTVEVIAGRIDATVAHAPAPNSWAADPQNELAIWLIRMDPQAKWTLPLATAGINRRLYFYKGSSMQVAGQVLAPYHAAQLVPDAEVSLQNGETESYLLLLQGKPIGEPVVQHGPFVANSPEEMRATMNSFYLTQFGGWPWSASDHVHPREKGRFAKFADGTLVEK